MLYSYNEISSNNKNQIPLIKAELYNTEHTQTHTHTGPETKEAYIFTYIYKVQKQEH